MSVWSGFIGAAPPWPSPMRMDRMTPAGMRNIPVGYFMGNSLARGYFGDDFDGLTQFDFNNQAQLDAWAAAAPKFKFGEPYTTDLRPFKSRGGKVIFWNGVSDPCCLDQDFIKYYNTVGTTVGGTAALTSFARFYKVPGMAHCGGGPGSAANHAHGLG